MEPTSLHYEAIVGGRSCGRRRGAAIPDACPSFVGGQAGECGAIPRAESTLDPAQISGRIVVAGRLAHVSASSVSSAPP